MKKRNLRFIVAILLGRLAIFALRRLGRNATHYPGYLALKICPDFLARIAHPKQLIAITGTNGKTTTTNFINDLLAQSGLKIADNSLGSNIQEGIITTMIKASSFLGGRPAVDLVVLEVDERVSPRIYPYLKPDWLVITNLFRDSYRRNAHVGFIADILEANIPETTRLIVNTDDVISSTLCPKNPRLGFSVARQTDEPEIRDSLIRDIVYCPKCDTRLIYDFNRYHHIGHVHCPACGFANLKPAITVCTIGALKGEVTIDFPGQSAVFPLPGANITDTYNMVAAIALLYDLGTDIKTLQARFAKISLVKTRYHAEAVQGKRVIVMMAKDQNPVAVSRVFDYIRRQSTRKASVILINENSEHHTGSENMAWYYDCDFEYLNQDHILQVIGGGHRILDMKVRCLYAGIPESRLAFAHKETETAELVDVRAVDDVYILYGTKTEPEALTLKKRISERIAEVSA